MNHTSHMLSPSKNFTVFGASGFIGSRLVTSLRASGHSVFAPMRTDATIYERDLGHVIYCIGLTADFRSKPFDTVHAHVGVLANVLEFTSFESLLYLSSTRVYGNGAHGIESNSLQVNSSDLSDLYNLTKLTGESLCRSCAKPNIRVARLSNVTGYDPKSENFLSSLIQEAIAGCIELRSSQESSKDYILVDDVVKLLPLIALHGKQWIYNVASGINLQHAKIVEQLIMLTGCTASVRDDAPCNIFPPLNNERIRLEFAFSPASVLESLPLLISQYRNQQP